MAPALGPAPTEDWTIRPPRFSIFAHQYKREVQASQYSTHRFTRWRFVLVLFRGLGRSGAAANLVIEQERRAVDQSPSQILHPGQSLVLQLLGALLNLGLEPAKFWV